MRRRHSIVVTFIAICLALSSSFSPALAGGLISTERLVASTDATQAASKTAESTQLQRFELQSAMVSAGVDQAHAQARINALTDAEIAQLTQDISNAPAGGLWFVPFLVVAAVIGILIGTRSEAASGNLPTTDLFGRPRNMAFSP